MDKKKKIFLIIFVLFTLTMIGFAIHLGSLTTSPWTKKKLEEKYRVK